MDDTIRLMIHACLQAALHMPTSDVHAACMNERYPPERAEIFTNKLIVLCDHCCIIGCSMSLGCTSLIWAFNLMVIVLIFPSDRLIAYRAHYAIELVQRKLGHSCPLFF